MTAPGPIGPVPWIGWRKVAWRLRLIWDPIEAEAHIAIYAMTRRGKSYFIRHVILPLCGTCRVVIIDAKGHDRIWEDIPAVAELPENLAEGGAGPAGAWWRVVANTDEDPSGAVTIVEKILRRAAREGHVVVIIDEGLDLEGVSKAVDKLLTKGGSHGVSVVISATSAEYTPPQMRRQCGIVLIGQLAGRDAHESAARIASLDPKTMIPVMAAIPRRAFLYADRTGDTGDGDEIPVPMLAITQAPAAGDG
jgi:hypothetical protein